MTPVCPLQTGKVRLDPEENEALGRGNVLLNGERQAEELHCIPERLLAGCARESWLAYTEIVIERGDHHREHSAQQLCGETRHPPE